MKLDVPPPEVAHAGLRALQTIAAADGAIHDMERSLLESVQSLLLGTKHDLTGLGLIGPKELADAVPEGVFRERILRGCTLMALVDGEASEEEEGVLEDYAAALGVDVAPLKDFKRILHGKLAVLRIDIVRRSFIGKRVGQHVQIKGIRGLAEAAIAFRGGRVEALAKRFQSLETYPEGTLGKAYFDFVRGNEFALPGEPHGAPEPIVFHDCVHVLAGYDTTPEEEVLAAAFQAGFQQYDPFFSLLFVICQFHLGIQISPIAGTDTMKMQPATMLEAFVRGTKCTRDLSDHWDPWDHFSKTVAEQREEYSIDERVPPPRS